MGKARRLRPVAETMEGRRLPSGLMLALMHQPPPFQITNVQLASLAAAHARGGPGTVAIDAGAGGSGGGGAGASGGNAAGASESPLLGQGTPTPHELARETFRAAFAGPFTVGPGRFSDQRQIISLRGNGGSTQFLHGNYQMAVAIPVDPAAPTTGEAVLYDRNNSNGSILGLELTAVPGAVDRAGRPTLFTFTADPNIFGGTYFITRSQGTVQVRYAQGTAKALFQGLVYTTGLTNPSRNSDLVAK